MIDVPAWHRAGIAARRRDLDSDPDSVATHGISSRRVEPPEAIQ